MPIKFSTVGSGLTRSGTYLNITGSDWSIAGWVKATALPTASDKYCIWHWGDLAHINPYIALYWDSTGIFIRIFDGTTTTNSSIVAQNTRYANIWYYLSITYFANTITFWFNGSQSFTISKNLSTVVFVEKNEYLGTDTGTSLGGLIFEYFRTWETVASVGNMSAFGPGGSIERGEIEAVSTAETDTPLTSATDLDDISGNNRDWTLIGSATTELIGPLDLVGGLYTNNFNGTPPFNDFTWYPNSAAVESVGCSSSSAFGCGGNGQIWRQWNEHYQSGALRTMMWPYVTNPSAEYQVITVDDYYNGLSSTFQLVVYIEGDGSLRLRVAISASTVDYYTSAGLISVNGTAYALQLVWEVNSLTQRARIYINNTEVLDTGTISSTGLAVKSWNRISLNAASAGVSVFDNIEVDNVGEVEVYNRCTRNRVANCVVIPNPANPGSGLYKMVLDKTNDTIYTDFDPETTENVAIPDPSITTALFGDEQ